MVRRAIIRAFPTTHAATRSLQVDAISEVAAFIAALLARPATAARCLEFLTLNASRSADALGARWSEIDLRIKLGRIPGDRMKEGKPHLVPLSTRAIEILTEMEGLRIDASPFVFPGTKAGRPLSSMVLEMLMRRTLYEVV